LPWRTFFSGTHRSTANPSTVPLIFVPTPLGNLGDVTLRALDALRDATLVVAEDTRVARKLLHALGIAAPDVWSYREQNAAGATPGILERARTERVVVTTDAGMPGVSDPGTDLVAAARDAGVEVVVLPGPSAALGVALLSGFPLHRFAFEGFPARTSGARRKQFLEALRAGKTTLWFESPQRIGPALADLGAVSPEARVFLVREYTKLHEQQVAGTPQAVAAALGPDVKGEIAFAIAPADVPGEPEAATDAEIEALLARGHRVADVAKLLAREGRGERNDLYARAGGLKRARDAKGDGALAPEPEA
jgi:16S rRNA (cytidine1402-2'-O)-methyltransferase